MKKVLFLILFGMLLFVCNTFAQTRATTMLNSGDTLTNADTVILIAKVTNPYDVAKFQLNNKKVSGKMRGNSYFEGSLDGVYYKTLDTYANDTLLTWNVKFFEDVPSKYLWYRIRTVTTGTISGTSTGYLILRR